MRAIIRGLANDNGTLRGLTGQGEPRMWTLLGGSGAEEDASTLSLGGGSGQVSAVSRVARANGDTLISGIAAGRVPGGGTPVAPIGPVKPPPAVER
jgi:hypothetical protein